MKKACLIFFALFIASVPLYAGEATVFALISKGPYEYFCGGFELDGSESIGVFGVDASFAGAREHDMSIKAVAYGGVKISKMLEPILAYDFSRSTNDIARDIFHGYDFYAYSMTVMTHAIILSNTVNYAGVKIKPFIEGRYAKLELNEAISFSSLFYGALVPIDYRELIDLNAGGRAEWQALDWLTLSMQGNKRIYLGNPVDAVKSMGGLYVQSKDIATLKTSGMIVDYSAALGLDAKAAGILAGFCYEYVRYHVNENTSCSDFSQNFAVTAGYEFSPGTKAGVKCEVITNHYLDGYMLSSLYLNGFVGFAVK